jgi:cytochrome c oxidase cbb3-type subunit 3
MRYGALIVALTSVMAVSCDREKRVGTPAPAAVASVEGSRESELQPGVPIPGTDVKNPFEGNYDAMNQGKRLFSQFNCAGCHSPGGGGGIGPPLIDPEWIYGNNPANIYETIIKGRPNGMPSFGGKIPSYQIWQLVTYVRNMSDEASSPKGAK